MENREINKKYEEYWLNKFEGEIPILNLPVDNLSNETKNHEGTLVGLKLNTEETSFLRKIAEENGLTMYMTLFSLYTILLSKLTRQDDIIIGVLKNELFSREDFDDSDISNENILPVRNAVKSELKVTEYVSSLKANIKEIYDNKEYSFDDLVEKLLINNNNENKFLFNVFFNFESNNESLGELSELNEDQYYQEACSCKYDLTFTALDNNDNIIINFIYPNDLFKSETIKRYLSFFSNIIHQIKNNDDIRIDDIDIITEEEKQKILFDFNDTHSVYPSNKTLYQLFEEQVKRTPKNIAVYSKNDSISYVNLESEATKIANIIITKGIQRGSVIGLIADRSIEMICGIFGILKAGCCYLPIMPQTPQSRLEYILNDSECKLILTQTKYIEGIKNDIAYIDLEKLDKYEISGENPKVDCYPTDLAYIIYTSGTTGNPKGVMIENNSVVNRINWMHKSYPIESEDIILQKTPYTFDVSVWEIFWWFLGGAAVYMLEPEGEKDPELIARVIDERKINVLHFVPSMLDGFLKFMENSLNKYNLTSIKYVFASGEALKSHLANKFIKLLDHESCNLINLYGPTEATVDVSYFNCQRDVEYNNIPIGKPIDNTQLYILDENTLKVQPIGIAGELMISGVCLSRGYLKQSELTMEKFIENPFKAGERLYRTGDLAKWLTNGDIEFLGRLDHQVKIRGFRIELEDIEENLLKCDGVEAAVVTDVGEYGAKYLCAYIVGNDFNKNDVLKSLSEKLPEYMIPSYFIKLDNIPLTSNGKVNRKALPEPKITKDDNYKKPINDMEIKLVEIWSEVLEISKENISLTANFFEIGGTSVKLIELNSRINAELGREIPIMDMFNYPTIEKFIGYINEEFSENNATEEAEDTENDHEESMVRRQELFKRRVEN